MTRGRILLSLHARRSRLLAAVSACAVLLAACADDPELVVETARVAAGQVVETIAAPATIQPRARVTVTAPAAAEVVEVLVEDGQQVTVGQPLLRLRSDSVQLRIAQAQAALDAAGALGEVTVGMDLSPLVGAVRGQLDAVIPGVLDTLAAQIDVLPEDQRAAALISLADARASYEASRASLTQAERDLAAQAARADASQRAAARAQRRQAELALAAAEDLEDGLTILAPAAGVVELAHAAAGGASLDELAALGGGDADAGALSGLLGGAGGASHAGPIAAGVTVGPGQALATVFDLGGFFAQVAVDEVDAVALRTGQSATVLVDAFPDAELSGIVASVAIEPTRGPTGGVVFPVTVRLVEVPAAVGLRVGLTASAEIVVAEVEAELVVPSSALLRRGGQEVVYVVVDRVARRVPVRVLAIGDDAAAITVADGAGLAPGDRVVTRGVEDIEDGAPVPEVP